MMIHLMQMVKVRSSIEYLTARWTSIIFSVMLAQMKNGNEKRKKRIRETIVGAFKKRAKSARNEK